MKFWKFQTIFLGVLVVLNFFAIKHFFEESKSFAEQSNLPQLNIDLNGVTLEEIYNNEKGIKYPNNQATFTLNGENFTFDNVEIKGRGNSTWLENKKPFQIKFEEKENLFGMGKAKTWVLLANQLDDSHLRNDIGLFLAEMVDMNFVKTGEFIELSINNENAGLYYLTHKVNIGKNSVDLKDPNGVLFELDNVYGLEENCLYTNFRNCLILKDSVLQGDEERTMVASQSFLNAFNILEEAAKAQAWEAIDSIIDVDSFVKYYLVSEFSANPDAYWTSHYFYKNKIDDKISAGPAWDFDFAFSNYRWGIFSSEKIMELEPAVMETIESDTKISPIFFDLIRIPEFETRVKEIFQEKMSGKKDILLERIDKKAKMIHNSAVSNNQMWERDDFEESVEKLKGWISDRYDFFEETYGDKK